MGFQQFESLYPPRERALASLEKLEFFLASKSPEKGDATGFLASGIFSVMNRCKSVKVLDASVDDLVENQILSIQDSNEVKYADS